VVCAGDGARTGTPSCSSSVRTAAINDAKRGAAPTTPKVCLAVLFYAISIVKMAHL